MSMLRITSQVEEALWLELKGIARVRHQSISTVLTDVIRQYLRQHNKQTGVQDHLTDSIHENKALGKLLAK